ncbi:MAG: hypothetical protein L3J88_01120 [Gammaproteobacteria bacterium]|nr:hypothetical protein [Gammaproteobacteria bacterium]MCF6361969.1 hypothetical protein [Gammaproteobacteria bacterium]
MDSRCLSLLGVLGLLSLSPGMMAAEEDRQAPDLALLEFLGSWEDADGEWIDPLQMLDVLEAEDTPATSATDPGVENDD